MNRIAAAASALAFTATAHAHIIADSVDDWNAAVNDGFAADGSVVTPGSSDDAPQQGHTDRSGSGTWTYGFGRDQDGGGFSGGFPLMTEWNGAAWTRDGFGFISATGMGPLGSSLVADPMAYRRWTSNGSNAGDTLTATLSFELRSDLSDGITIVFTTPAGSESILIPPADAGTTMLRQVSFIDFPNASVLVGIRPDGTGPFNAGNFFNDSASTFLTITPAPASVVLALPMTLFRRRR